MTIATLGINIDSAAAVSGARDIDQLVPAAQRAERAVDRLGDTSARSFGRADVAARRASRSFALFANAGTRAAIQNSAFQVADLSTQLASGTRASTAFAQQLPQLLGGLGALGAVLGAGVAIGLPLLAKAFRETAAEGKNFETVTGEAKQALEALRAVSDIQARAFSDLAGEIAGSRVELQGWVADLAGVRQDRAKAAVEALVDKQLEQFTDTTLKFSEAVRRGGGAFLDLTKGAEAVQRELGLSTESAIAFAAAVADLKTADGFEAQAAALRRVLDLIGENADATGVNTTAMRALREQVHEVETIVRGVVAASSEVAAGTARATAAASALAGAWGEVARSARAAEWAAQGAAAAGARAAPGADFEAPASPRGGPADFPLFQPPRPKVTGADFPLYGYADEPPPAARAGGGAGAAAGAAAARVREEGELQRQILAMVRDADSERAAIEQAALDRTRAINELAADSFTDVFMGAVDGADSFRDALAAVSADLARMAASRAFRAIFEGGGFGGSAIGQLIGDAFGIDARAAGGPVQARRAYLVGEDGPELFVPREPGRIVAHDELARAAGSRDFLRSIAGKGDVSRSIAGASGPGERAVLPPALMDALAAIAKGRKSDLDDLLATLGRRAAGGPVNAGQAYVVGEQGMELFVPRQDGRIMASREMYRGREPAAAGARETGPRDVRLTVNVAGATGNAEVRSMVAAGVAQGLRAAEQTAGDRIARFAKDPYFRGS